MVEELRSHKPFGMAKKKKKKETETWYYNNYIYNTAKKEKYLGVKHKWERLVQWKLQNMLKEINWLEDLWKQYYSMHSTDQCSHCQNLDFFFSLGIVKLILNFIRNLKGFWAASTILKKELNWMTHFPVWKLTAKTTVVRTVLLALRLTYRPME